MNNLIKLRTELILARISMSSVNSCDKFKHDMCPPEYKYLSLGFASHLKSVISLVMPVKSFRSKRNCQGKDIVSIVMAVLTS